jgi:myo-inositol-1(or 4)-monophosphatase
MTALLDPPVDPGLVSRALEVGGRLANDAAEVIAATADRGWRLDARSRPHPFDWVTDTGRTLERHSRRVLTEEFPEIPVLGEEQHVPPNGSRYRWLVAPLDGATNFRTGLPWFGYSLALLDAAGPVVGVISDPSRSELYAAARGRGTKANGVPVRVSARVPARGLPLCLEPACGGWPTGIVARAAQTSCDIRILGSPVLAVAQVALGHAVAAVLEEYQEWEVAAALALALEAGAVVLDRTGAPRPLPTDGLLVAAPAAAPEIFSWWQG